MRQDIRTALRLLLRDRGFTVLAALALGLGMGVNSTFFSLANAAVLRGLPIDAPGDVMFLTLRDARNVPRGLTLAQYEDLRRSSRVLTGAGAYATAPATIRDDDSPLERVPGASVSVSAFRTLGVAPLLGRDFRADDDHSGAAAVALIGHRLWQSRYGARPSVLGQTIADALHSMGYAGVGDVRQGKYFELELAAKSADQALANPYCYEWLTDALQPNYDPDRFRGQ